MALSRRFETRRDELEEDFDDKGGSDLDYDSDDSESDPSFTILEETSSKLSRLSIKKKSNPSKVVDVDLNAEADIDDVAPKVSTLDKNDDKDTDEVLRIVKAIGPAGKLEILKVEQCKAYLRKNGLRLTGNKETLIQRINEHLEILNGGGEKKYPASSFILNCKGDACTGDIVMFEQKVYEMYNVAYRSSIGPSCGTRIVAGRIVKESYGTSKQQHTFTIEVLWSKGEKPLSPLHPLLIKGRNLYRLKTLRQSWKDEGERQKVIMEKHARGSLARSNREARVLEKEKRKILQENRISRKQSVRDNSSQSNLTSAGTKAESTVSVLQQQCRPLSVNSGNLPENQTIQTKSDRFDDHKKHTRKSNIQTKSNNSGNLPKNQTIQTKSDRFDDHKKWSVDMDSEQSNYWNRTSNNVYDDRRSKGPVQRDTSQNKYWNQASRNVYNSRSFNIRGSINHRDQTAQHSYTQRQRCRYYAEGRCYYGENCKFFHDRTENCYQREGRHSSRWL